MDCITDQESRKAAVNTAHVQITTIEGQKNVWISSQRKIMCAPCYRQDALPHILSGRNEVRTAIQPFYIYMISANYYI